MFMHNMKRNGIAAHRPATKQRFLRHIRCIKFIRRYVVMQLSPESALITAQNLFLYLQSFGNCYCLSKLTRPETYEYSMTFYSVFVNLRKKCALDCCTITNLNEINRNSPIAKWIVECFRTQKMWVRLQYYFSIFFFHFFFNLTVSLSFLLDFVHNWIHLFEFCMLLCNKYTRSTVNNFNKPTCDYLFAH